MQTKQWTETNVSSDYVGVLNLERIIPSSAFIFSTNSVISFSLIIWLRWYNSWICFITQKVKWKNSSVRHLLLLYFIPFPPIVNGGWSGWSAWSGCAAGICAGNQRIRTRTCTYPIPSDGGAWCTGENAQRLDCLSEYSLQNCCFLSEKYQEKN